MRRKRAKNGKERCVKLSLNSVLRDEFRTNFVLLTEQWCNTATIVTVLASLLFLFKCNKAFDEGDDGFFYGNGLTVIEECFTSVLDEKKHTLPWVFRQIIERAVPRFRWPKRKGMGNSFNYLVTQFKTNVKNNLKTWAYSRIKTFFTLQRYELNIMGHNISEIDV